MEKKNNKYTALLNVMKRELRRLVSRPLYLFCMVIAPLFCYIFFTTLMDSGLPTDMPVGVVDRDMTATSRQLVRNLDAFEQTAVVARYPDISDARIAMQKGEIYGFYYIPEGTVAKAQAQRQPKVSFYTNNTLLIAGSLLFKDMKMMSELASGAAARTALYAKGATEEQAMAFLQPIVIDTHPLNNPWLNYSVYLCNTFAPGVLMLLIFMITVYSIGVEIKDRTARECCARATIPSGYPLPESCCRIQPYSSLWESYTTHTCTVSCISPATAGYCRCCSPRSAWCWHRKEWAY